MSIVCGTVGVGPCQIRGVSWRAQRASCLYIFGGHWEVSACEIRYGGWGGAGLCLPGCLVVFSVVRGSGFRVYGVGFRV